MLSNLYIQNYAIIYELKIAFSDGLNIITGETGAGKSILMGALGLILGDRFDSTAQMNPEKKSIVEGTFTTPFSAEIKQFFIDNELDFDEKETLLRREISASGKSRAFINDTPVTIQQLKEISSLLVDLHRQQDTLQLGKSSFQREILDGMAGNANRLKTYQKAFQEWKKNSEELQEKEATLKKIQADSDYKNFQLEELQQLKLKNNELEDLEQEQKLIGSAEAFREALSWSGYHLEEGETPVLSLLQQIEHKLNKFAELHSAIPELIARISSSRIELKDITEELSQIKNEVQYDETRINEITERLEAGYRLLKKHNGSSTADLLDLQKELEAETENTGRLEERISELRKTEASLYSILSDQAISLSKTRHKISPEVEKRVNALLKRVGMQGAAIKVSLIDKKVPDETGLDEVEILFDANKSGKFESIRKIASGGELSRLMLCIKSLVMETEKLPTMIFDEIDAGISGEAARQVGLLMKELSSQSQILCITHQPQIAGKAHSHFYVYKSLVEGKVRTGIKQLSKEERIETIAQMLSGEKPTQAAFENAREMIEK